jgi:hypothetical protein
VLLRLQAGNGHGEGTGLLTGIDNSSASHAGGRTSPRRQLPVSTAAAGGAQANGSQRARQGGGSGSGRASPRGGVGAGGGGAGRGAAGDTSKFFSLDGSDGL